LQQPTFDGLWFITSLAQMLEKYAVLEVMTIGIGDGGGGQGMKNRGAHAPKNSGQIFSGNYHVKFRHFSGKYHV